MAKDIIQENEYDQQILQLWEMINSWGWRKFIPLEEFFEKFNVPEWDNLEDRIHNNIIYYRTNYLAIYCLMLLIVAISSPLFAVMVSLIAIVWILPFIIVPRPFIIGEYRITPSCIVIASGAFTLLSLFISGKYLSGFTIFHLFFILIVLLHASFRNDSLKSKVKVGLNEKIKNAIH